MRKIRNPKTIADYYNYAKQLLADGKRDEARDAADNAIILIAEKNRIYKDDNKLVEGTRMGLWVERVWYFLENNGLLLGQEEWEDKEQFEVVKIAPDDFDPTTVEVKEIKLDDTNEIKPEEVILESEEILKEQE